MSEKYTVDGLIATCAEAAAEGWFAVDELNVRTYAEALIAQSQPRWIRHDGRAMPVDAKDNVSVQSYLGIVSAGQADEFVWANVVTYFVIPQPPEVTP